MHAPRIQQAKALVAALRDALDAADLEDVMATTDALLVPSGARHGIVVVAAPKLDFSGGFRSVATAWEIHVVAGPVDNYLAAWERIDTIIQSLIDGDLNLSSGEPGGYGTHQGDVLPAYTLTTNDLDGEL